MTLHPEIQEKAQVEIDTVVGNDRLPGFSDRPDLPYINAIGKEILKWNPFVPMGTSRFHPKQVHSFGPKCQAFGAQDHPILRRKTILIGDISFRKVP